MKKLIALMLALALALSLGCTVLAEAADAPGITPGNWMLKSLTDTDWVQKNGDASMEIRPLLDDTADDTFQVTLRRPDGTEDALEWIYYGVFDWETGTLNLVRELCFEVAYGADGEMDVSSNVYDRECDVTLDPDEDGLLVLRGSEEEQISLLGFEPVPAVQEKVTALTESQTVLFAEMTENLMGVDYEPVGMLAEADDLLFCYLCKATVVVPGAEPVFYLALISKTNPEGPAVHFIQIMDDGSEG